MDFADLEQRPAKKRRFFVEDSPIHDSSLNDEPPLPDEVNALPEATREDGETQQPGQGDKLASDGFDIGLLSNFVGEQLPEDIVTRLRGASGGDVQRGNFRYGTE